MFPSALWRELLIAKSKFVVVNMRHLCFKLLKCKENNQKLCYFYLSNPRHSTQILILNPNPNPHPSTPIEPGGTYARSPSPESPYYLRKKIYPLSWVLVTIGSYKKHRLFQTFSGNLPKRAKTMAKKYPPFPR